MVPARRDPSLWPAGGVLTALEATASRGISRLLRRHGYDLIVPPESFPVTRLNTLVDGESSRARRWAEALAAAAGLVVPAA